MILLRKTPVHSYHISGCSVRQVARFRQESPSEKQHPHYFCHSITIVTDILMSRVFRERRFWPGELGLLRPPWLHPRRRPGVVRRRRRIPLGPRRHLWGFVHVVVWGQRPRGPRQGQEREKREGHPEESGKLDAFGGVDGGCQSLTTSLSEQARILGSLQLIRQVSKAGPTLLIVHS